MVCHSWVTFFTCGGGGFRYVRRVGANLRLYPTPMNRVLRSLVVSASLLFALVRGDAAVVINEIMYHSAAVPENHAQEWIELQALKLTNYRSLTTLMQTGIPGPEVK